MIAGSTPATPVATTRASGSAPSSSTPSSEATSKQAAPSLRVEALPAVTVPPSRKTGRRPASFSGEASGAGPLVGIDGDRLARPFGASIGTISSAKRPRSAAATARWWLRSAKASCVLAADPVALGDVLGGLAHRVGRDAALVHARVDHAPAEGRVVHRLRAARQAPLGLLDHPRRPAHRLDPAGEVEVALAQLHRARRRVDRLQARGAEPVHGRSRDAVGQPGEQRRHARDVAVVLARLVGGAEVDVGDRSGSTPVRSTTAPIAWAARSSGRTPESAPR